MSNKSKIQSIKQRLTDLRYDLSSELWLERDPDDIEAILDSIEKLESEIEMFKKKKRPVKETHMDMKLKELLPVGKITPRKPITEMVDITITQTGVLVGIDDYDDVTFVSKSPGLKSDDLLPIIEALSKTRWFKQLVIKMAKTIHVGADNSHKVGVGFADSGITFDWR